MKPAQLMHENIYKTVYENLRECGKDLPVREDVACAIYGKDPFEVDVSEFDAWDDDGFLQYLYFRCLNVPPDRAAYDLMHDPSVAEKYVSNDALRLYFIMNITHLRHFRETHKRIKGLEDLIKKLRKEGRLSIKREYILRLVYGEGFLNAIYEKALHPAWMMFSYEKRQEFKKLLRREQ